MSTIVSVGREICGDFDAALRREWLVTNGLGGYASGTLAGVNTRGYHGLLVAALDPRTVLVAAAVEHATYDGNRYALSSHEYADGTIDGRGYEHLGSFSLDGMLPVWTFALADALLERRIWMPHGANTTYVMYRLRRVTVASVDLEITPLITCRDFHTLARAGAAPRIETLPKLPNVRAIFGEQQIRMLASGGIFDERGEWYWNFLHREERARGLGDIADLYAPGTFRATLRLGDTLTIAYSCEDGAIDLDGDRMLATAQSRQRELLERADAVDADPVVQQLTLAADQFVVERAPTAAGSVPGTTIIAGYQWFNDWGRDTMIALPGLTLATGRPADAASILPGFAPFVRDGLLPNNFPDAAGVIPGYNTVDASLWYVLAIQSYVDASGDGALARELLPIVRQIIDAHIAGTRYGIGVDAADGLLRAGEPGVQLTWMDAKVGDWVVTPRIGKPVEINALWYNALCIAARLTAPDDAKTAAHYDALADRARASFVRRFVRDDGRGLADVVDGPDVAGDDLSIRPNQIFAVSLPHPLLDGDQAKDVVDTVARELLTTIGLRSLSRDDPSYRGAYGGDPLSRDGAYHQGTVWPWLLGPFAEAHHRVYGDAAVALAFLRPLAHHLADAGLGTISEIADGDPPHTPRGCIAQAWSVAETLRVWRKLVSADSETPSENVGTQL